MSARRGSGSAIRTSLDLIEHPPAGLAWVEVHTENYLVDGGPRLHQLERIRERYALSLHGVGLSLGSAEPPDPAHLARIRRLADRFAPALLSEHIAWSIEDGHYLNDLFPIPYTEEALAVVARNVAIAQDALGRPLMVENPSSYLRFVDSTMPECEFVAEIARRAGCGILLDINNIHVSAHNHGFAVADYLETIPGGVIGEFHLAGHATCEIEGSAVLIDDHASRVDRGGLAPVRCGAGALRPAAHPDRVGQRDPAARRCCWTSGRRRSTGSTGRAPERPVPTLREVQASFARAVIDPALADGITGAIVGAGITPERRLGVYRNNVLASLARVLEGRFPATRRLLGPARFAALARDFIRAEPPDRPQLTGYGAAFAGFLERRSRMQRCPGSPTSPGSSGRVRKPTTPRTPSRFRSRAWPRSRLERYPELRFEVHPSLRLVRSAGPVYSLWRAVLDDAWRR